MASTPAKLLGDYLRATKDQWSHAEFCRRSGISPSTVTKILAGERGIAADVGERLATFTAAAHSRGDTEVEGLRLIDLLTAKVPADDTRKAG